MKAHTFAIYIALGVALFTTYKAFAEDCVDARICYTNGKPPVTVMQGTPLWGDIPVAEVPLAPMQQAKPEELVATADLDQPHNILAGADLTFWNQYCRGHSPQRVYEWRYNKCNSLDPAFAR